MSHPTENKIVESLLQPPNSIDADDSESSKFSDTKSTSDNSNTHSHSDEDESFKTKSTGNSGLHEGEDDTTDDFSQSSDSSGVQDNVNFELENSDNEEGPRNSSPPRERVKLLRPLYERLKIKSSESSIEEPKVVKKVNRYTNSMCYLVARYHKELCVAFLLIASAYAALRNGPPKTRAVQTPQPFFAPEESSMFLQDNYKGEYVDLVQKSIPVTPSFVFYYAPWDSESVAARKVFLRVAQHFHSSRVGQVRFFAVNCWWPDGQCRQNYKNLSHYPIFVAHIGTQSGIIYSGPIREELMIKFMESVLKPITRLDNEEELWRFRTQHDAIMLASFNFSEPDTPDAYETYLQMALRNFESDPFGQVGFGIFLQPKLGEKFFLNSANAISLVLFNEIHTAKWHGVNNTKAGLKGPVGQVVDWIIERTRHTPITWAYRVRNGFANRPVALGSIDFVGELNRGPLFLLITRRYFPSAYSPFYAQVKEVALDYFNCNKSINVTKLRRFTHKINAEWMALWKSIRKICLSSKVSSPNCEILGDQLEHWEQREALFAKEALAHYENISASINFTGFSCNSQRQFRFLTVDPVDVPHFISLGLGGLGATENSDPLAFIIDAKNEIILPFTTFNISELAKTIHNFTVNMENGNGQHFASSSQRWVEKSQSFPPTEILEEETETSIKILCGDSKQTVKPVIRQNSKSREDDDNRLRKLTSKDLLQFITKSPPFENDVPLLLLYTANYCGFCKIALAHMISLSMFLSDFYYKRGVNITLAKIDTLKNSLPIELSPEQIPSIVFFPANNRTDSRIFPIGEEVNAKTLLRFLLSELDPKTRVQLSLLSPTCHTLHSRNSTSHHHQSRTTSRMQITCIRKNKELVADQIHSILEKLRTDLQEGADEIDFNNRVNSYYTFDGDLKLDFVSRTWRNELLDHLRSMRLTLDSL